LRFQLQPTVSDLAVQLEHVGVRIDVRADPVDRAAEHLVRIGGGHGLERLRNVHAGKLVLVEVGSHPYLVQGGQREKLIAGIDLLPRTTFLLTMIPLIGARIQTDALGKRIAAI